MSQITSKWMSSASLYTGLIAICGYPGSGKDTFYRAFKTEWPDVRLEKFAYSIQDVLAASQGFYEADLSHRLRFENREWKETAQLQIGDQVYTPRQLLKLIGTECFRGIISEDSWTYSMHQRLTKRTPQELTIITDLRFADEYRYVKQVGGIVIYIERPSARYEAKTNPEHSHSSEQYVDTLSTLADAVIMNTQSSEQFETLVSNFASDLYQERQLGGGNVFETLKLKRRIVT